LNSRNRTGGLGADNYDSSFNNNVADQPGRAFQSSTLNPDPLSGVGGQHSSGVYDDSTRGTNTGLNKPTERSYGTDNTSSTYGSNQTGDMTSGDAYTKDRDNFGSTGTGAGGFGSGGGVSATDYNSTGLGGGAPSATDYNSVPSDTGAGIHARQYDGRRTDNTAGISEENRLGRDSNDTSGLGSSYRGENVGRDTSGLGTTAGEHHRLGRDDTSGFTTGQRDTTSSGTTGRYDNDDVNRTDDRHRAGDSTTTGGKPSVVDKIIGGAEKATGKVTSNEGMYAHGQQRATGANKPSSQN